MIMLMLKLICDVDIDHVDGNVYTVDDIEADVNFNLVYAVDDGERMMLIFA